MMHRTTSRLVRSLPTHNTPLASVTSLNLPHHYVNNITLSATTSPYLICTRFIRASPVGGHDYVQHAKDHAESKRLVLHLYKKILRTLPIVLSQFQYIGAGTYDVARHNIRQQFNTHQDLTDLPVIDLLRHKTELEWEESMLMHKTKSHFDYTVFGDPLLSAHLRTPHGLPAKQGLAQSNYLKEFYQGTV